jgi:hypothetical protein
MTPCDCVVCLYLPLATDDGEEDLLTAIPEPIDDDANTTTYEVHAP